MAEELICCKIVATLLWRLWILQAHSEVGAKRGNRDEHKQFQLSSEDRFPQVTRLESAHVLDRMSGQKKAISTRRTRRAG